jgi:hypothetical protein
MTDLNKLSRAEMKNVLGGVLDPGCLVSECTDDKGCTDPRWPHCYISTCIATGAAANYCSVADKS